MKKLLLFALVAGAVYFWFGNRVFHNDLPESRVSRAVMAIDTSLTKEPIVLKNLYCSRPKRVNALHCNNSTDADTGYFSCYHLASR
jgi:hypothetical protein